jgi:L-alanine-DL-glutamate epimerase-like enolase superfamily enzyme
VVVVELEEEGIKGTGECTPYPRYGESDASVMAQIMSVAIRERADTGGVAKNSPCRRST